MFLHKAKKKPRDSESNKPTMAKFLLNSTLMKKITDRLITPFNNMTTFSFRRSVEKAFQLVLVIKRPIPMRCFLQVAPTASTNTCAVSYEYLLPTPASSTSRPA
jgi:hypothetical protein